MLNRARSLLSSAAAAVAVLGTALVLGTVPAGQGAAAETVTTRVGTYNIRAGVSTETFTRAVRDLSTRVDVAGLQEVNRRDKESALGNLSGFDYFRPDSGHGEQNPVIWDSDRFSLLSATHRRLNTRTYIGSEVPKAGPYVGPMYAAVVRLRDASTGARLTVVNVHLMRGAVQGGNPVPGRPRVWRLFTRQVANLMDVVAAERANARTFVTGDFNCGWVADERTRRAKLPFMSFRRQGFVSNWATRHDWRRGTYSKSLIDQVWTNQRAATASIIFSMGYSDHYPGLGTYQLPVSAGA